MYKNKIAGMNLNGFAKTKVQKGKGNYCVNYGTIK